MMRTLLITLAVLATQAAPGPRFEQRTFKTPDGSTMRYGLAVPGDYVASRPRPLVVALHPGGTGPYYGDGFMRSIFMPGLRDLGPIMIAPDAPGRTWAEPRAEQAVMSLVAAIADEFSVDTRRMMVTGFSMGGAGTWYLSARHADRFTAAIVVAGRSEEPLTNLARIPTYVIHSRADEVVPFNQAEQRFRALETMGRPIAFDALSEVSHYSMGSYVEALTRGGRWVGERWKMEKR
jgi:predicted peptidase